MRNPVKITSFAPRVDSPSNEKASSEKIDDGMEFNIIRDKVANIAGTY
jgi:hypothetical protein